MCLYPRCLRAVGPYVPNPHPGNAGYRPVQVCYAPVTGANTCNRTASWYRSAKNRLFIGLFYERKSSILVPSNCQTEYSIGS